MNSKQDISSTYRKLRSAALCLMAMGAVLALGIDDASARGGFGDGGRMAQGSISGANRSGGGFGDRANAGDFNRGNIDRGNVNVGNNVNVDIDRGYNSGWGGDYHPIAAGIAIGAVAVTTAAVLGSYYYSLPPTGCSLVDMNGISYSYCGSVYYQQTWSGNDVVYVVVNP